MRFRHFQHSWHESFCGRMAGATLLLVLGVAVSPPWADAGTVAVQVIYPEALSATMQKKIAPAFEKATGYRYAGHPVFASKVVGAVAHQKDTADVVICANPRDNLKLIGLPTGPALSWYLMFMRSPLVLGYAKGGKFASQLQAGPWYAVAENPGFRLGVIDPDKDAQGQLVAEALHRVVKGHNKNGSAKKLSTNSHVVPASGLVHRLKSKKLDAAFFYLTQAAANNIPNVPLQLGLINTTYTVSVLDQAPHPQAASAFAAFLLSAKGQEILTQNRNIRLMSQPVLFGSTGAVPKRVRAALRKQATTGG